MKPKDIHSPELQGERRLPVTISECVRKAITGRWRTVDEVQHFVRTMHGAQISGSNCSARIRELRKRGYSVACRHLHDRRWEYKIIKGGSL